VSSAEQDGAWPAALIGPPVQIAYAVSDVTAAAEQWVERFGAGPFFVRHHIPVSDVIYRGTPASFDHSSAYGQWGPVMVELVEDHTAGPSAISELFPRGQNGLHHHAHCVDDLDDAIDQLARLGFPVAMSATATATRFCFIDTLAEFGHFVELYARSERLGAFYRMVAEASDGWDGSNPVRLIG
jgi:hypothetical protein